jgi:acyl dehydratase
MKWWLTWIIASCIAFRLMLEKTAKSFEEINIGDTLGPEEIHVSKERCRAYARQSHLDAARFTDDAGARKEGLPGMILPGNMSLGLITKLVTDWIGNANARVKRIGTTYRLPVQPDHTFVLQGFVTNSNPVDRTVEVDLWMENEDAERLVIGTATVVFGK